MGRTVLACVITALVTAGVTTGGSRGAGGSRRVERVGIGETAIFAGQDAICVNEPASGSPRFRVAGVACSSAARPYGGVGVWITRDRVVITRPPNARAVATYLR